MCGICGIYEYASGEPAGRRLVESMAASLRHRGPADDGFHFDGPLGLGFRRLSIIDLTTGHQPMPNEDETRWVILNGEIYNYRELRHSHWRQRGWNRWRCSRRRHHRPRSQQMSNDCDVPNLSGRRVAGARCPDPAAWVTETVISFSGQRITRRYK